MSQGLLDFFVLEASEYTEQLDGALARSAGNAPDLDLFTRNARALRGSATMARVDGIAKVATGLERLGRGLRDGSIKWSPQLRGAIVAAVDDVEILVRAVRAWGPAEDARAAARTSELDGLAPAFQRRSVVTPMIAVGSGVWLSAETADIAADLRRWADQGGSSAAMAETVKRVRALRGIAALADLPPLKDVIDTIDDAAKALELGAAPSDVHRNLFRAAADLLREASDAVQAGRQPNATSPAVSAFTAAAALLVAGGEDKDYVVPIAALFTDGGGEHVIETAANPPTTPAQRFRLEVVSQAEHLRRLIADARSAGLGPARQKVGNEIRAAVRALQRAAESFSEAAIARQAQALVEPSAALELSALDALEQMANQLAAGRAAEPTPVIAATPVVAAPVVPPAPTAAPRRATVETPRMSRATGSIVLPAPTGQTLRHALDAGLSGLARLNEEPLAEPAHVPEDDGVVPIQDLLYRGKAALARAREVGDAIKAAGLAPDPDALAELFDLLELAASE